MEGILEVITQHLYTSADARHTIPAKIILQYTKAVLLLGEGAVLRVTAFPQTSKSKCVKASTRLNWAAAHAR
jgi:hypothetical protein